MKRVIFISGPYRGDVEANILKAKECAIKLWQAGWVVLCPHLNTANFDGFCDDSVWLEGDLELLKRCDAIYMMRDWESSQGARAELKLAIQLGKEVIYQ